MIVVGSPVYWHNMSGSVRNLLDRFYGPVSQGALAEVLPGISIQENTLDSDRLNEILEGYLEEHKVRQEEEDG